MKRVQLVVRGCALALLASLATESLAATYAYWRFEDGPVGADVQHTGGGDGVYGADVPDVSGNGHHLSTWTAGGCCGYVHSTDRPLNAVLATGEENNYSVVNTGGGPGMFTGPTGIESFAPAAFTIEASFMPENGGFRTIVGRDSLGAADINGELAALYFQLVPGDALAIKFADQDGFWHEAISDPGAVLGYDNPNAQDGTWYNAAAVSDGSTLSLYLAEAGSLSGYQLVAQTDIAASGSTNTGLTAGLGDGGDWDAGNFSIGRGLYNGGHGDRAYGFIDEVRISDSALDPSDFLFAVPEPTSAMLMLLALAAPSLRRQR